MEANLASRCRASPVSTVTLLVRLSGEEIQAALADHMDLIYGLITTWESIGILVFRNQVSLDVVDDFFSGPIRLSWEMLEPHVAHRDWRPKRS
jgi:putative heme iron utilization protein